jgi:hypothetical protein
MEIYDNTFTETSKSKGNYVGQSRGGVSLFYNNTIAGYGAQAVFPLSVFRNFMGSWGGATGSNSWDQNAPGGPFYSGTAAAASSNLTVTVSGANWVTNQWMGYSVKRKTNLGGARDFGFSQIVSNTTNTLTYHDAHSFGTGKALSFAKGDSLQIWKVSQAMDMPGVSGGELVTVGSSLSPLPNPPSGWNNQVVTPCYSWKNTNLDNNTQVNFGTTAPDARVVVRGTHYFVNTQMPGYTPYTYPHPLTTGIAPPTNLTIVP